MRLTGAQMIIQLLERQGITTIAGIPGGANLPLYDALSQSRTIHHVLARHEQGAGFIAVSAFPVAEIPFEIFFPPSQSPFPRPSPQGTPEALPSPILRRLSSTSQSHAAPGTA